MKLTCPKCGRGEMLLQYLQAGMMETSEPDDFSFYNWNEGDDDVECYFFCPRCNHMVVTEEMKRRAKRTFLNWISYIDNANIVTEDEIEAMYRR